MLAPRQIAAIALLLGAGCGDPDPAGNHDGPWRDGGSLAPVGPETPGHHVAEPSREGPPFRFEPAFSLPLASGGASLSPGFSLVDFDGDGDLDVFMPMLDAPSLVYRNDGDFHFTALGEEAGIPADLRIKTSALGDCDADGDLDMFVASSAGLALLIDEGDHFRRQPGDFAPTTFTPGGSVFFDADGDGDLDLYVTCFDDGPAPGCPDHFFRNKGFCRFTDESASAGQLGKGRAHGVSIVDPNQDGVPDLLVVQDEGFRIEPDLLLANDGTGHFEDVAGGYGLQTFAYSMSAAYADLDGDGILDVYTSNICRHPFSVGQGPGARFVESGERLGVSAGWIIDPDQPPFQLPVLDPENPADIGQLNFIRDYMRDRPDDPHSFCLTGWATEVADLDADGWNELFIVNGGVGHPAEARRQPDQLFWRQPGAETFTDVAAAAGVDLVAQGRTGAVADLDGDGRLDLVIGNGHSRDRAGDPPSVILRNATPRAFVGQHLFVSLHGTGGNTDGIGAVVEVRTGDRTQIAYRTLSTSFLAGSAAPLHFGLGTATKVDEITVRWPWGGGVDTLHDVEAGASIVIEQGSGR